MSLVGKGKEGEGVCRNCVRSEMIWRSNGWASGGASDGAGDADIVVAIKLLKGDSGRDRDDGMIKSC